MRIIRFLTIVFGMCLVVSGCKNKEQELRKLRSDYQFLADDVSSKDFKLKELRESVDAGEKERKETIDGANQLKIEIETLQKENGSLKDDLKSIEKEFEDYKESYKTSARKRYTGHELDRLVTKSGSVYEKVKIKKIEDDLIGIIHVSGAAHIPVGQLDEELVQKFAMYRTSGEEIEGAGEVPQVERAVAWTPSGIDDVADCSLMVWVTSITPKGRVSEAAGSAFLCNADGFSYIYTNAHNLDGVLKVEFKHSDGRIVKDFAQMEIAKSPYGYYKGFGQGGDVVRIRLINHRGKALTLAKDGISEDSLKDSEIYITGNTKGRGKITKLKGKITEIIEKNILKHNVRTQAGNSGSPIVRASDCKVIGILTWGSYDDENPFQRVWSKQPDEVRKSLGTGPLLYDFKFELTSLERMKKQRLYLNKTRKLARMMGLMDAIVPTHTGLFVNLRRKVSGDYTVNDILTESSNHRVIRRLTSLHKQLEKKSGSNIPYSNIMILEFYYKAIRDCTRDITSDRQRIENEVRHMHFYFKGAADKSKVIKVCRGYEAAMGKVLAWYKRQTSLHGDPIPLSERVRLPSINGGFAKYLKAE